MWFEKKRRKKKGTQNPNLAQPKPPWKPKPNLASWPSPLPTLPRLARDTISRSARYRPSPVAARPPFPLLPRGPEPARSPVPGARPHASAMHPTQCMPSPTRPSRTSGSATAAISSRARVHLPFGPATNPNNLTSPRPVFSARPSLQHALAPAWPA